MQSPDQKDEKWCENYQIVRMIIAVTQEALQYLAPN